MAKLPELPWIAQARGFIGLREDVSKIRHNPRIVAMLERMGSFSKESKAWWKDDETPWCGLFVGYCLGVSKRFVVKEWFRARSWESPQLAKLAKPAYGAIVTFSRVGGGHVGFIVGKDAKGNLMVLGGNQSNAVSIIPFAPSRVTGIYWPAQYNGGIAIKAVPDAEYYDLPLLKSNGQVSTNEA